MVSGCTCTKGGVEHFRIGTGFDFVGRIESQGAVTSFLTTYCSELGAYYGTFDNGVGLRVITTAPGGIVNLRSATGPNLGTSKVWNESNITISPCSFCEFSHTVSGNGSVSDTPSGNARKYDERYRKAGDGTVVTATAASGYKLKKLVVNGSNVQTTHTDGTQVWTYTISNIQQDYAIVAYFVPAVYNVTCNTPTGGTVAFTKNGTAATPPFSADVDDVIVCTATPNADKMVQNFVVDGYVTSGGSTGPQSFTFTVYEREDDATYNCSVAFSDRTAVADSAVGVSGATFDPESETPQEPVDDATVTCNGTEVQRDANGVFAAFVGNVYVATAHEPTVFRTYGGWRNGNGETVSAEYSYGWTQGSAAVAIVAHYADKPLYSENFLIGTSTSDAGTQSGTAYSAGCRATITRPEGESKVVGEVTKYLGGTRTVTATETPTGWTFTGVYVSDTDASGGTRLYKANGASSVTFETACNANVYAIFANGASVAPSDVDQGDSQIASGQAADGLFRWEGVGANMEMRYLSKMFVASAPMALSTARVYADGYSHESGGSDVFDVKLKARMFQSPNTDDVTEASGQAIPMSAAKSQDAFRLPMRRPEKYVEIELTAPHQVTQVAVATSMEALWQA